MCKIKFLGIIKCYDLRTDKTMCEFDSDWGWGG